MSRASSDVTWPLERRSTSSWVDCADFPDDLLPEASISISTGDCPPRAAGRNGFPRRRAAVPRRVGAGKPPDNALLLVTEGRRAGRRAGRIASRGERRIPALSPLSPACVLGLHPHAARLQRRRCLSGNRNSRDRAVHRDVAGYPPTRGHLRSRRYERLLAIMETAAVCPALRFYLVAETRGLAWVEHLRLGAQGVTRGGGERARGVDSRA